MFKHILVPLDGSQLAESTLPVAATLAEQLHATVILIHVIEKSVHTGVHGDVHLSKADEADAYLHKISETAFPATVKVSYHVHEAEVENVANSIVAHKDEFTHDLVVMCTHGRGRAMNLLFGSIAQQVIAKGTTPVLLIHPDRPKHIEVTHCQTMLVPLDGNPQHEQSLQVATDLAAACSAILHLITVVETFTTLSGRWTSPSRFLPGTTSRMLDMSVQDAEAYLDEMLEQISEKGVSATATVLRGDPAEHIRDAAQKVGADVIVLGTHGKLGMYALYEGSVANKVCCTCDVPLLLIPVGE
ncbi:universal stress protein [candidate division KSB1 bacterium]|nr:universal stress protein [candidate division KSB1 bacterium]